MSAAILDIEEDMGLSPLQAEVLVGSLNVIAAFGGLIAGKASDALGRKTAIAIACGIFITGAGGMTLSMTYAQLLTGRLLTGLGVGCGFVVAPVYITEITPPHIRGKLVALTDIMINIGILLGYITGFACQELIPPVWLKWRVMLGLGILPPAVIVISLTFLPESPRWLISRGRIREGYQVLGRVIDDPIEAKETLKPSPLLIRVLCYCEDVGVMSAAILDIEEDMGLSPLQAEVLVGSLNVIAAFGGLIAGKASDALGRKTAIAIACGIFITGAGGMTLSMTYAQLLTGRLLTGLGVGCGFVVAPVYITEITPPHIRGKLVALTDIMINIGILLGYITGFACQELIPPVWLKWRVMLGLGILPPAVIVISLTFLPESPRWLISRGRIREGYQVLGRVIDDPIEAKETLKAIVKSVQSHGNAANGGDNNEEPGWMEVLWPRADLNFSLSRSLSTCAYHGDNTRRPTRSVLRTAAAVDASDKVVRAALFVGLGLGFWQQASGSEAAVYYSPHVLEAAGMTSRGLLLAGTCMVGVFKLLGEVLAAVLIERVGRRPLFLLSSITSTLTLLLIAQSFFMEWSAVPTLVVLCAFMFCFSIGLGPLTFVVAAEVLYRPG
ncbi:unnamed protein product [Ectocarpus sp. CCAP 1310/34]|nr:unnamed protein product [Ectocarpus sp. CCAP 1310/34]